MKRLMMSIALWLAAVFAVFAVEELKASADDALVCDGRPLPALQRATCRAKLEEAWQKAAKEIAEQDAQRMNDPNRAAAPAGDNAQKPVDVALPSKLDEAQKQRAAVFASFDRQDAYDANHCDRQLTLCLDRDGEVIVATPSEAIPQKLQPGELLTVVVLTSTDDPGSPRITVHFDSRKGLDSFVDRSTTPTLAKQKEEKEGGKQNAVLTSPNPPKVTFNSLSSSSGPVTDDAEALVISFQRARSQDDSGIDKQIVIPIEHGRYYYSVALLVAGTYKGDRRVLPDLTTTSDHAVEPGLALNIFPGGRERGIIGYLRRGGGRARWFANNFGLQLGTGLDLTHPFDRIYAGVVFEPVAGLALAGGVTLRKVDVVPPPGALPAMAPMDGSSSMSTDRVIRGYIGITITSDLLTTISSAVTDLRKLQAP